MNKNILAVKGNFIELIHKKKRTSTITLGVIIIGIICLFIFIPKIQSAIRISELNYLNEKTNLDKKISFFNEQDIEKQIKDKNAITVLFSEPNGTEYEKVLRVFSDTKLMNSFNHSLFIYPIVYNSSNIEKNFEINKNEVTIIFFEEGKEKNRLIVDRALDTKTMLIPQLNELPLSANINKLQDSQPAVSSQSSTTSSTIVDKQKEQAPAISEQELVE